MSADVPTFKRPMLLRLAMTWADRPANLPLPLIPIRITPEDLVDLGKYIRELEIKALAAEVS